LEASLEENTELETSRGIGKGGNVDIGSMLERK
jgi:hypothetical protein